MKEQVSMLRYWTAGESRGGWRVLPAVCLPVAVRPVGAALAGAGKLSITGGLCDEKESRANRVCTRYPATV